MTTTETQLGPHTTALVTGGGGFLGRAIVERLRAQNVHVRSLARGDYPALAKLGVKTIRGDLADAATVQQASAGCDIIFHVAAKAGVWGRYADYHRANVIGTDNVLAACRTNNIPRLVYTSSPSVVFASGDVEGADESLPYPPRHHAHYSATKAIAEQNVLAANSDALRTLALRPHLIWGPRDNHIVPRLVSRAQAGRLLQVGEGNNMVDTIYIDNAADAHLLAAEALLRNPAAAGRTYFITNGEPWPLWKLINRIIGAAGLPPIKRRISRRAAHTIGAILEAAYTVFRVQSEPRMTRFVANELATHHWFDISAAKSELGYTPRVSIETGLQRLKAWYDAGTPNESPPTEQPIRSNPA